MSSKVSRRKARNSSGKKTNKAKGQKLEDALMDDTKKKVRSNELEPHKRKIGAEDTDSSDMNKKQKLNQQLLETKQEVTNSSDAFDVVSIIKRDHALVKQLFAMAEKSKTGIDKLRIMNMLIKEVCLHSNAELLTIYPALKLVQQEESNMGEDLLKEALKETFEAEKIMEQLQNMNPDDSRLDSIIKKLKEDILHHAEEEEEAKILPKLEKALSKDALEAMGIMFLEKKAQSEDKPNPDMQDMREKLNQGENEVKSKEMMNLEPNEPKPT